MKNWLIQRFLPLWAKETVLRENRELREEIARLRSNVRELESYIRGMHKALGRCPIKWTIEN